ncbi:MAG TPA: aminotransferase class III-fold pyridoxal phosphate-dependent enzyme, partial [Acidimicrobiales bacterium]|nr:aminotransferase class III-fold pyridoxal phosphate-dependent enzyme [Acidimicrobiales bacterium]
AALDERVRSLPAVKEVRLCGLMGGVELAPAADGLRWGRRVCAEAVGRGVLLRPLGDVIVLMPMLTTTSAEIDRIVDVLQGAIVEVCR